ncbi:MAG: hypothetical protein WCQ99_01045 [Pseudomonadota bacterium]
MKLLILKLFCIVLGVCLFYTHSFAALVKELNLGEMCTQAHSIFSGICIEKGLAEKNILFYKFKVLHLIKGEKQEVITVRMHKAAATIARAPSFEVADEVILFLYPESSLGFTTPVGFGQGRFSVRASSSGEKTVTNDNNNANLFRGFALPGYIKNSYPGGIQDAAAFRSGPVSYQAFMALLEAMVR